MKVSVVRYSVRRKNSLTLSEHVQDFFDQLELSLDTLDMWYLGSPYTTILGLESYEQWERKRRADEIMDRRVKQNIEVAQQIMDKYDVIVFVPLAFLRTLEAGSWKPSKGWYILCLYYLLLCEKMVILRIPGWQDSFGLKVEIREAKKRGIPIEYIDLDGTGKIMEIVSEDEDADEDEVEDETDEQ